MKKKTIYVINDKKADLGTCIINDEELKKISILAQKQNFEVLSCLTNLVLTSKSNLYLSYAINNLINYVPICDTDCKLLGEAVSNIKIYEKNSENSMSNNILKKYKKVLTKVYVDKDSKSKNQVGFPIIYLHRK